MLSNQKVGVDEELGKPVAQQMRKLKKERINFVKDTWNLIEKAN
jgi:hypothetical protein